MGCRLVRVRRGEEGRGPGKIYSTLRRPQVETKVGVAYTYHFLDFLLGKEEVSVSSVLSLSSVRELPVQLRELYSQGWVLVALHPFVHACGPHQGALQRQLHRAVLLRETHSSEKSPLKWTGRRLETDVCVSGVRELDPDVVQTYVKRIQDMSEQGAVFLGFLLQPGGPSCSLGRWDPEELSSLHSSPSLVHTPLPSSPGPDLQGPRVSDRGPLEQARELNCGQEDSSQEASTGRSAPTTWLRTPEPDMDPAKETHNNNNHIRDKSPEMEKTPQHSPLQQSSSMQLFALYNHTREPERSERFFSARVPLRVQREAGLTTEVDAHWLDHMTQHFNGGARLIDGFFPPTEQNDGGVSSVDGLFIFQGPAEGESGRLSYDAIVVEQWTVVSGVVVRTDYVPLLQSLAPYGWRLMCVLATPIVKTNSDGSLSTKQILFLQRPVLQRKRKDFKMLNLRGRKTKRGGEEQREEERGSASLVMETEIDALWRSVRDGRDPPRGGGEEETQHPSGVSPTTAGGACDRPEIDRAPLVDAVGWTDVCRRERGGGETIKQHMNKRALFSGVC